MGLNYSRNSQKDDLSSILCTNLTYCASAVLGQKFTIIVVQSKFKEHEYMHRNHTYLKTGTETPGNFKDLILQVFKESKKKFLCFHRAGQALRRLRSAHIKQLGKLKPSYPLQFIPQLDFSWVFSMLHRAMEQISLCDKIPKYNPS